ncbi:MAG: hypothetical protein HYR94_25620 [Chloroflexi bacterium]|nr:hypothetical protein [Chloroflexota bacterium]
MSPRSYNTGKIRELLNASFTADELHQLCYDEFRPVYDKLAEESGKAKIIFELIQYCEIRMQFERLLVIVKKRVPEQYAKLFGDDQDLDEKGAESVASSDSMVMPDENIQLQKLIIEKTRYLHKLQLQAARLGISASPSILIEIEDLEKVISDLQQRLTAKG